MNKILKYSLLVIIGLFVILGFVIGISTNPVYSTTQMLCHCMPSAESSELECNHISRTDFNFFTLLVNVGESCSGREIVECPGGFEENITSINSSFHRLNCNYFLNIGFALNIPLSSKYEVVRVEAVES
jgi:hypothetical protein